MRFDTRLVHLGQEPDPSTGAVIPPVHLSATYDRRYQDPPRNFYARGESPTREALERCLAGLEDVRFALAFSSGQAAAATALSLVRPGELVLASDDVYGGTHQLFEQARGNGVRVRQENLADADRVARVFEDDLVGLRLVWVETPTNPLLRLADIASLAGPAHERGAHLLVDNTLASPALQQPIALGADISLYSSTKSLSGHLDVLGGALVHDDPDLQRRFLDYRTVAGNVPGGLDCFLVHRGLKTLSLRVRHQAHTAASVAALLVAEPAVRRVHYPGLPGHPQKSLGERQMSAPGSIISFEYDGDVDRLLREVRLCAVAVSLGGVRSLLECPALMTHRPVPPQTRAKLGIGDDLVRLSIGIEDPADIAADIITAVRAAASVARAA
jgi:cystathionine gamma-lyase